MKIIILLFILTFFAKINSQVSINTSGSVPEASSILDVSSSSKGVLIPRMTTADRDLIGFNTFLGENSGRFNTTGSSNTFLGQRAGNANGAGNNNTFIGKDAGAVNASGGSNTFVGQGAGDVNTASNNTFIGKDAGGANTGGASNTAFLPMAALYNAHVMPDEDATWRKLATEQIHQNENENSGVIHSGFIAQEVEQAAAAINYDFQGLVRPQNEKDNYGIRYSEFTVPLVKAVQELNAENTMLKLQINALHLQFVALQEKMELLQTRQDE